MTDNDNPDEGWALIEGRWVAGVTGSANGKEHYFRAGRSLCGAVGEDRISMRWLGFTHDPVTGSCTRCRVARNKELEEWLASQPDSHCSSCGSELADYSTPNDYVRCEDGVCGRCRLEGLSPKELG